MTPAVEQGGGETRRAAREPLVANGVASVNRFPALRAIFDETSARFVKNLLETTGAAVEFTVTEISAIRVGEPQFIDSACAVAGVYTIAELKSKAIVAISFDLVLSFIDTLFGANVSFPFARKNQALTKVEARAAQHAMNSLIDAFRSSFSKIADTKFELDRVEPFVDWPSLGRKGSVVIICACRMQVQGRESEAFIVIPRSALDPFREELSRDPAKSGNVEDIDWANKLRSQVVRTTVKVSATMEKKGLTLAEVSQFKIGQVISLPFSPASLIPLECAGKRLFNCALGQNDGFYTVRIEDVVDDKMEFLHSILSK